METDPYREPRFDTAQARVRTRLGDRVAHVVSNVGSPPVTTTATSLLIAGSATTKRAWLWSGVHLALVVVAPLAYLIALLIRGRVTDIDVQLREQRKEPFVVLLLGAVAAGVVLYLGSAPPLLVTAAWAHAAIVALILGITTRWKISVHCAAAAGLAVLTYSLGHRSAMAAIPAVPLVAWSRVRLGRHTLAQTLAGIGLGSVVFSAALMMSIA
jgi:membrane-associated phospholipid phosphatase